MLLVSGGHSPIRGGRGRRRLHALGHHHRRRARRSLRQGRQAPRPRLSRRPGGREPRPRGAIRHASPFPARCCTKSGSISPFPASRPPCALPPKRPRRSATRDVADICASFQAAVTDIVEARTPRRRWPASARACPTIRHSWSSPAASPPTGPSAPRCNGPQTPAGARLVIPPPKLCTDNGAMVAWAGAERFALGAVDGLDFAARPRWPLDEKGMTIGDGAMSRVSVIGGGAWGTALAEVAARAGHEVCLIVRSAEAAMSINSAHVNQGHLPGDRLSATITARADFDELTAADLDSARRAGAGVAPGSVGHRANPARRQTGGHVRQGPRNRNARPPEPDPRRMRSARHTRSSCPVRALPTTSPRVVRPP